jgi:predicted nucleic acid-binding protein
LTALLVDAGVWVAARDPEDRFHAGSVALVNDFEVSVAALDLTLYEVCNAIGVRRREPAAARHMSRLILARCRDRLTELDAELVEPMLELAAEHRLTAYDAAYVAAARRHGMTLVSTDVADLVSKGLAVTPDACDYP